MTPIGAKAEQFRALHASGCFVIPNPWDAGSARILTDLGFPALATTSGGLAMSLGRPDNATAVPRDVALANASDIVHATHLPVSADLENGYGDRPEDCADTIRMASAAGLVGGSIEDDTGRAEAPLYGYDDAVARVAAAVKAARALPHDFVLVARCEGLLRKSLDLPDVIARLVAFAEVGADCLYAPGLRNVEDLAAVVRAVAPKPVNMLIPGDIGMSVADAALAGARRISVGSAMARVAYSAFLASARDIAATGRFASFGGNEPLASFNARFAKPPRH
jgi:2-methylisocitrate lyase-like PEP mutase family enzyme